RTSSPCPTSLLSRDPPHRDLPPFPTRRSSDLRVQPRVLGRAQHRHQAGVHALVGEREGLGHREAVGQLHDTEVMAVPAAGVAGQDRKSTRLNSSHVSISYAVFCLKKKKKNERP